MGRAFKNIYCFISDENRKFVQADQQPDGNYSLSRTSQPLPIKFNPANILGSEIEFATNKKYFSLNRSISYPLEFIKDGAAALRELYHLGKGTEEKSYLTIIQWNGTLGYFELAYYGKIDYSQKVEDPKSGKFTVPVIDDSAWGVLSQNESVEYGIECSARNRKAIRVLIDGVTLLNRYTFQTVQAVIPLIVGYNDYLVPFVMINQDGDSSGITVKNQSGSFYNNFEPNLFSTSPAWFFNTAYAINNVNFNGNLMFEWSNNPGLPSASISIHFITSLGQRHVIFANGLGDTPFSYNLIPGHIYNIPLDWTVNLAAGESVFIVDRMVYFGPGGHAFTITPIVTNILVSTKTKTEPVVRYALRPLDLGQEIVAKGTNGRFTINSNHFTVNNKSVVLSGDSIRGVPNAKIFTTFEDYFKSFNALNFMALRQINGELWIEKANNVYGNPSNTIFNIGDCLELELEAATEFLANQIEVGSPKQDYRHPSGRLEVNSTNIFSLPMLNINKKLSIVSVYRLGCLDIQFLILDYLNQSTKDNSGDKSVYVLEITDDLGSAVEDIETFENVTIDNALLEPIIKSPLNDDIITYNKPVIRGIAPSFSPVNIYVDTVLDGGTVADANGNWSYNIVAALSTFVFGVTTGIHVIEATFTDLSAPTSSISIMIDTANTTVPQIIYPAANDSLYNNKPLIRGVAQRGTVITVSLGAVIIGVVTADESCKWELQSPVIPNGNNTIDIVTSSNVFYVNSDVQFPLLTYIGSELDGFLIANNLPLIKGVASPGTVVTIWLNYISYLPLGNTTADANGNWEFQVIPINYPDPLSGLPVILAPIRNGLSVISTSLQNHTVGINVQGYKLSRPAFSSITGVTDNTIFNTAYSPKRMLENWYSMLSAIMSKQPLENVYFQKADKNGNLVTVLNGVTTAENTDIPVSSLGSPIAILEYAKIKTKTNSTFAHLLENFNNGGTIKTNFRGKDIYMLPIGSMKMSNIISDVQEWKLLLSPNNLYSTLLNLYKNGLTIQLMTNSLYHSDYNTLHLVTYNFPDNPKFNFKTIYDDWFENRNSAWSNNPFYIQKIQKAQIIKDQIITNTTQGTFYLRMFRCSDAVLEASFFYNPVNPAPIPTPDVVLETVIDFSFYDENQYFFVLDNFYDGTSHYIAISERVETKVKWENTILIEANSSLNKTGAFFNTGFKTILRVEGLVKKLQPDIDTVIAKDETSNRELLYSNVARKRTIRFGTAYGLPDYLYLKIADALTLDNLVIEGVNYVLEEDEKITPSDDVDGHPLYYYNVNLALQTNERGKTFGAPGGSNTEGIVVVVDATAFGMPAGSLIRIDVD